jgi:hypothetical protein
VKNLPSDNILFRSRLICKLTGNFTNKYEERSLEEKSSSEELSSCGIVREKKKKKRKKRAK